MWPDFQITSSVQLVVYSLSATYCFGVRQFHAETILTKLPLHKPFDSKVTERLLECVYSCVQRSECLSVIFDKMTTICQLYDLPTTAVPDKTSKLLFTSLRKALHSQSTAEHSNPKSLERNFILHKGTMNWKEAEKACEEEHKGLLVIKSDAEQDTVAKVANESGLNDVAIGTMKDFAHGLWVDPRYKPLRYRNWALGEPKLVGRFGVLSKVRGYKWRAVFRGIVHGRLCRI